MPDIMDTLQTTTTYYVVEQEQKVGPFDVQTLQTMRDQGRLGRETLVWRDGMSDWQTALSVLPQLFPSNVATNLYVATPGQRILACLIDGCVLWIPMEIVLSVLAVPTAGFSYAVNLAGPVVNALYHGLTIGSVLQGTIGMKLLGLKVVDYSGRPPSSGQNWGRAIASILSGYAIGIGYLFVFFTPRRQTLHDMMAATLVVKANPQ
jgi:uncharacterized RDD family membrane protein YckC